MFVIYLICIKSASILPISDGVFGALQSTIKAPSCPLDLVVLVDQLFLYSKKSFYLQSLRIQSSPFTQRHLQPLSRLLQTSNTYKHQLAKQKTKTNTVHSPSSPSILPCPNRRRGEVPWDLRVGEKIARVGQRERAAREAQVALGR